MRNYTEHTYLEERTVQVLTHVKCNKCGKDIGTFNLDNREFKGDIKYTGYGDDQAPHPKVWYLCRWIQNAPYDTDRGYTKDFDICPDCFVSLMNEFKEFCGNDSDDMEMFVKHMVEYEHGIMEENK